MLKLAICDDMPQEREALRRFLESYFAQAGYEVRAMGYLLKPLVPEKADPPGNCLYLQQQCCIAAAYREGETHRLYRKLSELEVELDGFGFLRCHQSFLVNLEHVSAAVQSKILLMENLSYI